MKITVGLFFGGNSVEHEVSIISGIQAFHNFDTQKYDVIPIYISREHAFYTGEDAGKIEAYRDIPALLRRLTKVTLSREGDRVALMAPGRFGKQKVMAYLDVAFPVVHGTNVEDGALQGYFRTLGLPFAGSDVAASAIGMDKFTQKLLYIAAGLPAVPGFTVMAEDDRNAACERITSQLSLPVIVKPLDLGSSVGIKLARTSAELPDALDYAFTFTSAVLVEQAVSPLRELNVSVLGDRESARASEVEEPVMGDEILSYRDKYEGGGKNSKGMSGLKRRLPAPISDELRETVRDMAVKAFKALGCSGVARIDFLLNGMTGDVYVNEVNTIPGSLSFYLWEPMGVKYPALLDEMVSLALKRERERSRFHTSIDTGILQNFSGSKGSKGSKGGKF